MMHRRNALCFSVVLTAFAFPVSVGIADSPSPPRLPRKAVGGADTAAPKQFTDPTDPKVSEAAALAAQQVLHRLEALTAREPKPPEPWAKGMDPGDPVAIHFVYRMPDGSLIPSLGGVHPVELRERVRELAFTGRISKAEYLQFRNDIMSIPRRQHAIPEEISYP